MSSLLFFAATASSPGAVEQIAKTFGANWPALISNFISFLIVALVLKKFAYGPVQKLLLERRARIEEGLANAEKTKAELANAQSKAQEILNQASQLGTKMIEEARAAAAAENEKSRQQAITDAQDILAKAKVASEAELARMKVELRREVTRLVVETSAKVTANVLTPDQKQRLADDTNRQLANN
ncbi:MAG TPA: F0F1 ATP synthase subunit B [Verrucomicrobiota bacterium]|nr:ATP synthase F0 subunit B [Verrucomicrobiales bacterium]HRI13100.1 F0F1 ATP synthase subunit B [Verrucomicrobiota bacterium]